MTWNYIAGFFDGEGSITHNGKGFRINITQTNKEVLNKIKDFTKFGYVVEITKRKVHWKDSWLYFISRQGDVYKFLKGINKYAVVKREVIKNIIPQLEGIVKRMKEKKEKRIKLYRNAKNLRKKGLTYRRIGKILKIDFGYARQIIIK